MNDNCVVFHSSNGREIKKKNPYVRINYYIVIFPSHAVPIGLWLYAVRGSSSKI